jgi:thymidylate kinase
MSIVTLEGIDCSGKGLQSEALRLHYTPLFRIVEVMHFPVYDSLTGQLILRMLKGYTYMAEEGVSDTTLDDYVRKDRGAHALALQALMVTNRLEQFAKLEKFEDLPSNGNLPPPSVLREYYDLLILDRYNESAIAYGLADGLPLDFLHRIHEALPKPAHRFLLDISVAESFRRRPKREDEYESSRERLEKARKNYLDVFAAGGPSYHVIDGAQAPGEITKQMVSIIEGGR